MQALFDFFVQTQKLKEVKRSGWALRGIKNGEHVSDHSFSVALMAYVFAKRKGLNEEKAIKMALVHDVFEVLTGDIPTRLKEENQPIKNSEKKEAEEKALKEILKPLDEKLRKEIFSLWEEFEEGKSREAVLVRELDKLDMALQGFVYEKEERNTKSLDEFFEVAKERIKEPELAEILELILSERKKEA